MLHILVILIILIHFYLCFKSLAYGCAFYIAVKMIIPTPTRVAGLSLYTFMLVILIFFAMVRHMVWRKDKKNVKAATFPFVYLIVGSIIKFTSPGPILFKQMRTGLNGVDFVCYKFRSMKVNDVADSKQAMLMVLVKQNLGIYFFVLILINFPSLSMCLKVVC